MTTNKPDLSIAKLINISFGFFGVQIAYALQSANISRIFATLGADPHNLSYFWILPPLMGILVQPLIGWASDKTWIKGIGRRKPYLLLGSFIAVVVMCMLPNAGNFQIYIDTMVFGVIMLMLLDTSINMAMQPFKMMVGDMVNEKQKGLAYSIQSFLCNAGSLVGYLFPFIFTWCGISNTAPEGVIPDSVKFSFYIGAAILILCVVYTCSTVKEMDPETFAKFHGIEKKPEGEKKNTDVISLLIHAPREFWTVGLVQLFSWIAFMYMWTYTNGAIAENVWGTTDPKTAGFQEAGNWVGVLFAVQAIGSVLWALVIPLFKSRKLAYSVSLLLGGLGFISVFFITNQYALFASYFVIGFAWAAMLSMPFAIFTNAVSGENMGIYLGLFNGTICLPQIIAALIGGSILSLLGGHQASMLVVAGCSLVCGSLAVWGIKETYASNGGKPAEEAEPADKVEK